MRIAGHWWGWALRGLAAIVFGILTFAMPLLTFETLVLLFGAYALVDGVFHLIAAFRSTPSQPRWLLILEGLLAVGVGIYTFAWPGITGITLVYLIGFWAIFAGIFRVALAIHLRRQISGEWLMALSGVLSIVFGFLIVLMPIAGALAVTVWIGAYALALGVLLEFLAFRLRRFETSGSVQTV